MTWIKPQNLAMVSAGATDSGSTTDRAAETAAPNHRASAPTTTAAAASGRVNGRATAVTCRVRQRFRITDPPAAVLNTDGELRGVDGCPTGGVVGVALPDQCTGGVLPAVQVRLAGDATATVALLTH